MHTIQSPAGPTISYEKYGAGPALLLVHGSFSDQATNWELVKNLLAPHYTVYAVARRGRGKTTATEGHSLEDEFSDVAALIDSIDEQVFLLGHSYGAHVALGAALLRADRIRKLVVYEPPNPTVFHQEGLRRLEGLASANDWDQFAEVFFRDMLLVPGEVLEEMRAPQTWAPIIEDARPSLGDVRAVARYSFDANHFSALKMPVLIQVGSESPRDLYVTDALAAVLPAARVEELAGQAHEGMTTAPQLYAESVSRFLV
jgi:pimeloyl-ACP methyl ester carboxylesterase